MTLFAFLLGLSFATAQPGSPLVTATPRTFTSAYLKVPIDICANVFDPYRSEQDVLPYMKRHPELFAGKSVLDVGTGSGVIALYAAALGARRVVATDISAEAIQCTKRNAELAGFKDVIDARLVPARDTSAYSVIKKDERFDLIISNPPFVLNLDAHNDDWYSERGDLGFSLVRGLSKHLTDTGSAALFYGSFYYHHVIQRFARSLGYEVANTSPRWLANRELNALFESYSQRLAKKQGVDVAAVSVKGIPLRRDQSKHWAVTLDEPDPNAEPAQGFVVIRKKFSPL